MGQTNETCGPWPVSLTCLMYRVPCQARWVLEGRGGFSASQALPHQAVLGIALL